MGENQETRMRVIASLAILAVMVFFSGVRYAFLSTPVYAGTTQSVNANEEIPTAGGYDRARWDPIHFPPQILEASNEQCLLCHQEILDRRVREASVSGLKASDSLSWYQTLDTYSGEQETFHRRHLETPLAKEVMDLKCNVCHTGNNPREEAPSSGGQDDGAFTLRKSVNPEETCLLCHGRFPFEVMEGLEGPWSEARKDLEDDETPNGCLTCHAELIRTARHQVNYLKPEAIETAAQKSSDVCYGCHGGRAWYRISYPYPRHAWPDMPADTPKWAVGRPTESKSRFLTGHAK